MADTSTGWTENGFGDRRYYTCRFDWDAGNQNEIISSPFNWIVDSDFTIFVNYAAVDTSTTVTNTLHIYGSADGANKIDMVSGIAIDNASFDGKVYKYLYDISTNGIAPFMFISLYPATANIGNVNIDMCIFPNIRRAD